MFNMILNIFFVYTYSIYFTDWEAVVKLSDGFNGADLRNVCTEAGKFYSNYVVAYLS